MEMMMAPLVQGKVDSTNRIFNRSFLHITVGGRRNLATRYSQCQDTKKRRRRKSGRRSLLAGRVLSKSGTMVRVLYSSMILLATARVSSAFAPAIRALGRRASTTSFAASDTDFDNFSAKVAFMFPGQGAQFVGMCGDVYKQVPAAKALFDEASEILGYDLLKVCTEGPKDKLDSTVVSQPAIFVASMAAVEKLKQEQGQEALDAATCAMV